MSEPLKTEMLDVGKMSGDGLDVTFTVVIPGQVERRYPMRAASLRVGRSDQSDIPIKDASVSSRHCDLVKESGRLLVRDLGSSNGTFVNGKRTEEGELFDGDTLRLGNAATLKVAISGSTRQPAAEPPPIESNEPGGTAMISADQLDAMRRPALGNEPPWAAPSPPPPPSQRPTPSAAPPPLPPRPRAAPVPSRSPSSGLVVGVGIGVAVVVLVGVIGLVFVMRNNARADDARTVQVTIAPMVNVLTQQSPCAYVQDSVAALTQIPAEAAPTLPVRSYRRSAYKRFIDHERDTAKQYQRIATLVATYTDNARKTEGQINSAIAGLNEQTLKSKAKNLSQSLDEWINLSEGYETGWKKLENETNRYADLADKILLKGTGDASAYVNFRFSKPAPRLHGDCRRNSDTQQKEILQQLAILQALVAH